ncbi:protein gp8 [Parageobacillus genomosp. 1]|uniref:Protein gp8 n=1 Tax=Parageobacillus genomosp. 1 TaxID=1295642 RepID=A0ABC9VGI6_9BACL|nr:hypothetical protein [Parageobacillus genomosp. 1]EZP77623.1 protein gp8 [Parageobacillus genomosp. 1]
MAYIDYQFYIDVYKGVPISDADTFLRFAERASDVIDQLTNYQIGDITKYPEWLQTLIKKAVAAQVEYFAYTDDSVLHGVNDLQNVKLGDFSYTVGGNPGAAPISPAVLSYLRQTGLLYRGVTVCD